MIKLPEDSVIISKKELQEYIIAKMIFLQEYKEALESDLDIIDLEIDKELDKIDNLGIKLLDE